MEENKIPDILIQANKEKFRRRLLISSRLLAFFLILALIYVGITMNANNAKIAARPCYYCGYIYGRMCSQQYDYLQMNASQKEQFFKDLGEMNENFTGAPLINGRLQGLEDLNQLPNVSNYNFSK
jgi:hypothetical protein